MDSTLYVDPYTAAVSLKTTCNFVINLLSLHLTIANNKTLIQIYMLTNNIRPILNVILDITYFQ